MPIKNAYCYQTSDISNQFFKIRIDNNYNIAKQNKNS